MALRAIRTRDSPTTLAIGDPTIPVPTSRITAAMGRPRMGAARNRTNAAVHDRTTGQRTAPPDTGMARQRELADPSQGRNRSHRSRKPDDPSRSQARKRLKRFATRGKARGKLIADGADAPATVGQHPIELFPRGS